MDFHAASGPVDRYAPPPPPGRWLAVSAAVLVHALLVGALTWGVNWREDPKVLSAAAELWAPTVQEAAPRAVEAPPPPPPAPAVVPPPPAPAGPSQADIALEREKKRKLQEQLRQQEEVAKQQKKKAAESERLRKLQADKAEARKREQADQKKRELAQRAREEQDSQRMAQLREENMRRIQGLAGATGGSTATGTAQRAAGPSDSWGGRIRARVRPNIVFTDPVSGNPVTEVEVRMAPDGTITSRKITKTSGLKAWDDAVLRALDRTEVLPRDLDGRIHSPLLMEFRLRD